VGTALGAEVKPLKPQLDGLSDEEIYGRYADDFREKFIGKNANAKGVGRQMEEDGVPQDIIVRFLKEFDPYYVDPVASVDEARKKRLSTIAAMTKGMGLDDLQPVAAMPKSSGGALPGDSKDLLSADPKFTKYAKLIKFTGAPIERVARNMGEDGLSEEDVNRFVAVFDPEFEAREAELAATKPAVASKPKGPDTKESLGKEKKFAEYVRKVHITKNPNKCAYEMRRAGMSEDDVNRFLKLFDPYWRDPNTIKDEKIGWDGSRIISREEREGTKPKTLERVKTMGGSDITGVKYMQLKKMLLDRGVSEDKVRGASGLNGLRVLGMREGIVEKNEEEAKLAEAQEKAASGDTKFSLAQDPKYFSYCRSGKNAKATVKQMREDGMPEEDIVRYQKVFDPYYFDADTMGQGLEVGRGLIADNMTGEQAKPEQIVAEYEHMFKQGKSQGANAAKEMGRQMEADGCPEEAVNMFLQKYDPYYVAKDSEFEARKKRQAAIMAMSRGLKLEDVRAPKPAAPPAGADTKESLQQDPLYNKYAKLIKFTHAPVERVLRNMKEDGLTDEEIARFAAVFDADAQAAAPPAAKPAAVADTKESLQQDPTFAKYAKLIKFTHAPVERVLRNMNEDGLPKEEIDRFAAVFDEAPAPPIAAVSDTKESLQQDPAYNKYAKLIKFTHAPVERVLRNMKEDGLTDAEINRFAAVFDPEYLHPALQADLDRVSGAF